MTFYTNENGYFCDLFSKGICFGYCAFELELHNPCWSSPMAYVPATGPLRSLPGGVLAKYLKGKGGNLFVAINKGILRAAAEPETKLVKFLSQLAAESIPLDGINIATILSQREPTQ